MAGQLAPRATVPQQPWPPLVAGWYPGYVMREELPPDPPAAPASEPVAEPLESATE